MANISQVVGQDTGEQSLEEGRGIKKKKKKKENKIKLRGGESESKIFLTFTFKERQTPITSLCT